MKDLQLVLFVVGAIAIIAVLIHGFWSIRRQQPKSMKDSPMVGFYKNQSKRRDAEGFDVDGIGEVRVRKSATPENDPNSETSDRAEKVDPVLTATEPEASLTNEPEITVKPQQKSIVDVNDNDVRTEHADLIDTDMVDNRPVAENSTTDTSFDNELYIDEDHDTKVNGVQESQIETTTQDASESTKNASTTEQEHKDVLVLHVVAKEGQQLQGAELLPSLLALNFKFGEMDIFHRHIDNAGTGDTLFSLANMVKPGTFDPDNMEQFTTQGVVLFMTLPCYGNPEMNFTIMLNSALALTDDLDAQLLDDRRQLWRDSTREQYQQRIKHAMSV